MTRESITQCAGCGRDIIAKIDDVVKILSPYWVSAIGYKRDVGSVRFPDGTSIPITKHAVACSSACVARIEETWVLDPQIEREAVEMMPKMNFLQALKTLADGTPVRRESWSPNAPTLKDPEDVNGLSVKAMLAEDWIAVPAAKKGGA